MPQSEVLSDGRLDVRALLKAFKERSDENEQNVTMLLARLDDSSQAAAAILALERSSAAQAAQIRELQQALSEAHTLVIQERELRLQHPHLPLHLHRGCDAHLATLAAPRAAPWQDNLRHAAPGGTANGHSNEGGRQQSANAKHDAQALAALRIQHEDEGRQAREHVARLLQEARDREARCRADAESLHAQLATTQQRLAATQAEAQSAIKDAIVARQQQAKSEADAAAAVAQLASDKQEAAAAERQVRRQLQQEAQDARAAAAEAVATVKDCRMTCARQLAARGKELAHTRTAGERMQQSLEQQLAEAKAKLARALAGRQQLEQRRALDVEGFTADIALLRKALTATDRRLHQMRLADRLEHDERLEALLKELQARPGAEVDAAVLEDISNIAGRRC